MTGPGDPVGGPLACVVLAHGDPVHVRRLVAALAPMPVYLHVDAATSAGVRSTIVTGLPPHVRLLPRLRTAWASWSLVEAELAGYAAAMADPDVTHVALLTGSDYPLMSTDRMTSFLAAHPGTTFAWQYRLPHPGWGRSGGLARLRFRHRPWRKHMLRLPLPRRIPTGLVLTGGSQLKVVSREHAAALLDVVQRRPDLVAFWRHSWIPDETFVLTVLNSPSLLPGFAEHHRVEHLWHIGWDERRRKSPPWLTVADLPELRESAAGRWGFSPALFARKFSTAIDTDVLDVIDAELRRDSRVVSS